MHRSIRLFFSLASFVLSLASWPVVAFVSVLATHFELKLDARSHAELDHAARTIDVMVKPQLARARAFISRCLTHDLFVGGRFDPGRAVA